MTHDKDFKRLVRHRMRKTGESYVSARAHLRRGDPAAHAASARSGEAAMHSVEKFTDPAKRALIRAQFEAEVSNSESVATTHLLLGLLHDMNTMAVGIAGSLAPGLLRHLFNDEAGIREAIEKQPPEGPAQASEGLVPSEPVKRTIELAFAEARVIGDRSVGTGHLLVGMLRVVTSSGARVMAGLGVTADAARAKLRELTEFGVLLESSTRTSGVGNGPADASGFADLVREVLARFERQTGTQTELVADDSWTSPMAGPTAHQLLRILEQALENVGYRGSARSVKITLERLGDDAVLTVQDDGPGLEVLSDGRGYDIITGIQQSAVRAGGDFSMDSLPGRGTTVRVSLPLHEGDWLDEWMQSWGSSPGHR